MKARTKISTLVLLAALVVFIGSPVAATPLPGQLLKFRQLPMDGVTINGVKYWGHDELSTALTTAIGGNSYFGDFMADDFADTRDESVAHVRWWGSYMNASTDPTKVRRFLISFESDVPAGTPGPDGTITSYSRPGTPLLSQIVNLGALAPSSGTFTEKWKSAGGAPLNEALYEYNAELHCPFPQKADTVYWLKIVALDEFNPDIQPIQWGWHNRDYTVPDPFASPLILPGENSQGPIPGLPNPTPIWHFQDDAVNGFVNIVDTGVDCDVQVQQDVFGPQNYWDGVDGPGPIGGIFPGIGAFSKDLAFELYYIPEPTTLALLGMGLLYLGRRRRQRA